MGGEGRSRRGAWRQIAREAEKVARPWGRGTLAEIQPRSTEGLSVTKAGLVLLFPHLHKVRGLGPTAVLQRLVLTQAGQEDSR